MAGDESLRRALVAVRGIQGALVVRAPADTPHQSDSVDGITSSPSHAPSAFISWAHSHSTWTREQTQDWESQVAEFAATLRSLGIDADIDLFHLDEAVDWTRFGPRGVQESKLTIVVLSAAWAERWSGRNAPNEGAGAAAEADTLRGLFSVDQAAWQKRIILVLLPDVGPEVVPPDLQRATRVSVDPSDPDTYQNLLRILTEQPRYPKPPLGEVPTYAASSGYAPDHLQQLRSQLDENQKRQRQLAKAKAADMGSEQDQLAMVESVLRGFIEAELKREE